MLGCTIALTLSALVAGQQRPQLQWREVGESTVLSWDYDSLPALVIQITGGRRPVRVQRVVEPLPFIVGDSLVVGILGSIQKHGWQFFRYQARSGTLDVTPAPAEIVYYFHDISISPDGRYVLYLAFSRTGEQAVVRRWPRGPEVLRSPPREPCPCDVDFHHAHWVTRDSFELATMIDTLRWERVAGSVARRRMRIDTILGEPRWH